MAPLRLLAGLLLAPAATAFGDLDCDSKIPLLCRHIESKAKDVFADTMGGNFSLLIGHKTFGRLLTAGKGLAKDDPVVVASASKMLSAAAILWAVDEAAVNGGVSIKDPLETYLPWWKKGATDPADPRKKVTLQNVLSQTDGFGQSPTFNFSDDAQAIFAKDYASFATPPKIFTVLPTENYTKQMSFGPNATSPYTWGKTPMDQLPLPGSSFYYEETHWRLAEEAVKTISGKGLDQVTADLATKFGMTKSHLENIPSLGGPEWISTAEDLETFLRRLLKKDFLKPETQAAFETTHTNEAEWYGFRARPDWGYAMGSWSHCPKGGCHQLSSIGLFGTFPFVDFNTGIYFALVRPAGLDPKLGVLMDRSVAFWEQVYKQVAEAVAAADLGGKSTEAEIQV